MPLRNGRLTARERQIARAAAATGENVTETARRTGSSISGTWEALQRPAVQNLVRQEQQQRLFNEVLPLAIEAHIALLTNAATPAGAKAQAVGLAYKYALPGADLDGKDPSEMTGDELARELDRLRRELADRAKPIIDQTPSSSGVFE